MDVPFFSKIYSQKDCKLMVSGKIISGFMDGAPFRVTFDGGEVDKTEGTDGPGLNRATGQGGTLSFTIRETSGDYQFLHGLWVAQGATGLTTVATFSSGARVLFNMADCLVSLPRELSTGDKRQGGVEFIIVSRAIVPVDVGLLQGISDSAASSI